MCGREFGDDELADAALRSMDHDCGRQDQDGVVSYRDASCLTNVWAVEAKLMRTGDFRNSFVKGPPASAFSGPQLASGTYPEVLVAKATSTGEDLDFRADDQGLASLDVELTGRTALAIQPLA